MTTINNNKNWLIVMKNNNIKIKVLYNLGKIWLSNKELSKIYGIKKSDLVKELKDIIVNSNLDILWNIQKRYNKKNSKTETFYSLDILLLFWYKSKHFKETKFLVNTNRVVKQYTQNKNTNLTNFHKNSIFNNVINIFKKELA